MTLHAARDPTPQPPTPPNPAPRGRLPTSPRHRARACTRAAPENESHFLTTDAPARQRLEEHETRSLEWTTALDLVYVTADAAYPALTGGTSNDIHGLPVPSGALG